MKRHCKWTFEFGRKLLEFDAAEFFAFNTMWLVSTELGLRLFFFSPPPWLKQAPECGMQGWPLAVLNGMATTLEICPHTQHGSIKILRLEWPQIYARSDFKFTPVATPRPSPACITTAGRRSMGIKNFGFADLFFSLAFIFCRWSGSLLSRTFFRSERFTGQSRGTRQTRRAKA